MRLLLLALVFSSALFGCLDHNDYKQCGTDWGCFQQAGANDCLRAEVTFSKSAGGGSIAGHAQDGPSGKDDRRCYVRITATGATVPDSASTAVKAAATGISYVQPSMDCYLSPAEFAGFSMDTVQGQADLDRYGCRGALADALKAGLSG